MFSTFIVQPRSFSSRSPTQVQTDTRGSSEEQSDKLVKSQAQVQKKAKRVSITQNQKRGTLHRPVDICLLFFRRDGSNPDSKSRGRSSSFWVLVLWFLEIVGFEDVIQELYNHVDRNFDEKISFEEFRGNCLRQTKRLNFFVSCFWNKQKTKRS